MALQYDANFDNPTLDINLPEAITDKNVNKATQPVANSNGSGGFNFGEAIGAVLGQLENGINIWKEVDSLTGGAASKSNTEEVKKTAPVVVSPTNPSFVFGLSTTQLLLIAGGLAAIIILPRVLKRI
jgi:hypothetical protein